MGSSFPTEKNTSCHQINLTKSQERLGIEHMTFEGGVGDLVQAGTIFKKPFQTLRNVFPETCTCKGMRFFPPRNLIFPVAMHTSLQVESFVHFKFLAIPVLNYILLLSLLLFCIHYLFPWQ